MKVALKDLISSKIKRINSNMVMKIISSNLDIVSDDIEITLFDNSSIYKNLYLIKGEIFPTPKNNDIIQVEELYLKHDENLVIKLYLKAKIIDSKQKFIDHNDIKDTIYCNGKKLLSLLKSLLNMKEEEKLYSSVFIIKNLDHKSKSYKLLNFQDLKEYKIFLESNERLDKDDFILIDNFKIKDNKDIIFSDLTMTKKLKEEDFFKIVYRFIDQNNSDLFKVIDIENNYLILINKCKQLFKLDNNNIKGSLGKIIFISNFLLKKFDNIFQMIIIKEDTYIQISKDEFYYSKNLRINTLSCVKFYIKDFKQNNQYDKIKIFNEIKEINDKEIIFVLSTFNDKNFDYFPIEINLYHTSQKEEFNKTFHFLLFKGLLNKINLFVNIVLTKSYFFEFFYLDISNKLNNLDKIFSFQNEIKENFEPDNFDSENRKRINLMNVSPEKIPSTKHYETEIKNIINNENKFISIQICYLINNNEVKIFGIFNLEDIKIPLINSNSIFDDYYDDFGNIYDELIEYDYDINNLDIFNHCIEKYQNCDLDKRNTHLLANFDENITLSQYKTRLGYLICYYLDLKKSNKLFPKYLCIHLKTLNFLLIKRKIDLFKKLRIITFFLRENIIKKSSSLKLFFFDELNPNNPYTLAYKFNIQEIDNINEFSRLFFAYIQLDSFILYNHCIKTLSYSFSMEPLFMIKYHLKSNYEEFFFTSRGISDKYAFQALDEKITVINEKSLFNKGIYDEEIIDIEDINESKNYALSISMEFRHEKNTHQKLSGKNIGQLSPLFYVRDLEFKKISLKVTIEDKIIEKGESGWMIESFICPVTSKIKELKTGLIYGELLDYKLFTNKNFTELFNKMEEINKKVELKSDDKNKNENKNEDYDNEKSDKSVIKHEKVRKIKDILRKYEEIGFMFAGDVIYSKASRENIKYLKNSDLEFKDENSKKEKMKKSDNK